MIQLIADHALLYACAILLHLGAYSTKASPAGAHPLNRLIIGLGTKLNRKQRSAGSLVWRGLILLVLMTALAAATGYAIHIVALLQPPYSWLLEIAAIAFCLRLVPAQKRLHALARTLRDKGERKVIELSHRYEPMRDAPVDAYAALRRGAEDAVRAYGGLVTHGLFYLFGGLPLLLATVVIARMALFYGRSTRLSMAFGWAAAHLWGGLLWLPERFAGLLLALASVFAAQCRPAAALKGWKHWLPCRLRYQCLFATAADATGIALGGPYREAAQPVAAPWLGSGTAQPGLSDMVRLQWLLRVAVVFWLMLMLFLAFGLSAIVS
jgi:cobalamin biosynthesis protein CobD/CbiB